MIATENAFSGAIGFLKDGYTFIQKRCNKHNSDIFQLALPGQNVICMRGEEAARVFYDPERFIRSGAIPSIVQDTLVGRNGVQTLDGAHHYHRKQMFMSLMSADSIGQLTDLICAEWEARIPVWQSEQRVVLFEETQQMLCAAVVPGPVFL